MRRLGLAVVLFVVVGALAWSPAKAADHFVTVVNNAYEPRTENVIVGDAVFWSSSATNPHTVTARPGQAESFDSHPQCPNNIAMCMKPGEVFGWMFKTPGTVNYFCKVHGDAMTGTINVVAAPPATTSPPTTGAPAPTTTARQTTTTARAATTTTTAVAGTTTSSSSTTPGSTTSSTTSTTELDELAGAQDDDDDDGDDGGGGVPAAVLALAIVAFLGAGGFALWRYRPTRTTS